MGVFVCLCLCDMYIFVCMHVIYIWVDIICQKSCRLEHYIIAISLIEQDSQNMGERGGFSFLSLPYLYVTFVV